MTKRDTCLIFIDNNRLLFYTKNASSVLQVSFSSDVVSDLEVINREKFESLINNLFQSPALKSKEFDVTLIFSQNTTFEKDLTSVNTKLEIETKQRFLDMVPFEDVLSNTYKFNKKTKIVAVNRNFYNIIKLILEKNKMHVALVLPMSMLIATNPELTNKIDLSFIENKLESLKQYSIIDLNDIGLGGEVTNSIGIKKKDVRLYVLIGVFVLMLLILLVLVYTTFISAPKTVKRPIVVPKISAPKNTEKKENLSATDSAKTATKSAERQQNLNDTTGK